MQRRITGAMCMILVRNRRPEQGHNPVAGKLVDETLEAFNAFGEDGKEPRHDLRESFGVETLSQFHRALYVGEENGHLLAFALDGGLGLADLVGEVFGGFAGRCWCRARGCRCANLCAAFQAEFGSSRQLNVAGITPCHKRTAAFDAEFRAIGVVATTR